MLQHKPTRLAPRAAEVRPSETKHEKFRRLANQRFRALKADMKRMGSLTGPIYQSSPDQRERLISLLEREFNFMVEKLRRAEDIEANGDIFVEQ